MNNTQFSSLVENYLSVVEKTGIIVHRDVVNDEAEPLDGFNTSLQFNITLPHEVMNTNEYDSDDEDSVYDDVCLILEENDTEVVGFLYNNGSFISSKDFRMNYSTEIIYHDGVEVKGIPLESFEEYFNTLI